MSFFIWNIKYCSVSQKLNLRSCGRKSPSNRPSWNTLLAILKVIDARRDVILAGGLSHLFAWRYLPPPARKVFLILFFDGLVGKLLTVADSDEAKLKTYLKINVSI